MKAALVTCAAMPDLYGEERDLLPMLRARGIDAVAAVWDDPSVRWSDFDAVVIRSTWDYFKKYDAFLAWLARVEREARVYNPPSLVRWNLDKLYLRDVERRGARIVPTAFVEHGAQGDLAAILRERGWEQAVIKPAVSGGAYRTHRVERARAADYQGEMEEILRTTSVLVQPFVGEIQTEGEWSVHFFDGAFSHAVLKVPAGGDYRIQPEFGGTFSLVDVPAPVLRDVEKVLAALPEAPAYARIDGVRQGGHFLLMEAELIEPYLYMLAAPDAAERYASLVEKLARKP